MPKKLTQTQQWEIDHPDDEKCPVERSAGDKWRVARGIIAKPGAYRREQDRARDRARYEAALAEKRAAPAGPLATRGGG